jgi:hypothetical protein
MAALQSAVSQLSEMLSAPYASQIPFYATPEYRIAEALLQIPEVESVYIAPSAEIVRVWTIIDGDDEQVYDTIYAKEQSLIQTLQERFDFHVIARRGRDLRSLITLNCQGWRRL